MIQIRKRVKAEIYNKKHHTFIHSTKASLTASYGVGVLIGANTVVDSSSNIGNYSYVNTNSSVENCDIGKYCSISSGVYINPAEHDIKSRSTYPLFPNKITQKRVKIGNDVLISLNAIVLKGVEIGDGAVIGAGAVVTKNVKPYEIVGGVPARHIGWRVVPPQVSVEGGLYNWWDFDIKIVKNNADFFSGKSNNFIVK